MTLTRARDLCALVCSGALALACGGWVEVEPAGSGGEALVTAGSGASSGTGGSGASGTGGSGGSDAYAGPFKILVLTTWITYRHDSIIDCQNMLADLGQTSDDQMPPGTKPGSQFTTQIATDDLADFTIAKLKDYGMLFWCTPQGPVFSDNPKVQNKAVAMSALQKYVEGGGAWGGVHSATDFETAGDFPWYTNTLMGAYAQSWDADTATPGTVQVEADYADHPIMKNMPATWSVPDEWFKMNRDPGAQPGFQIVSRLTRENRPVVWIKEFGTNPTGRMFYTIRGHLPAVYHELEFRQLVLNGILWATHRLEK